MQRSSTAALAAAALVATLLTAGCATQGEPPQHGSAEPGASPIGEWLLADASFSGGESDASAEADWADLAPPPEVTLLLENESSGSGFAGCNTFTLSYRSDGDAFSVNGGIALTRMACKDPGAMEFEAAYVDALASADAVSVAGDELVLSGGSATLRFERLS